MMGTPAEKETTQFVMDYLQEAGLSPYLEEIKWSNAYVLARKVMVALLIPWLIVFNLSTGIDGWIGGILSLILPILSIIFLILSFRAIRDDKFSYLGKMSKSHNVICDLKPTSGQDPEKWIYLTAHTDSVGSSMPKLSLPSTIGGFLFFLIAILITIIVGVLRLVGTGSTTLVSLVQIMQLSLLVVSIINALMISIGLVARRVNSSPGAIDNGSGTAVLLSLASYFHNNRPQNTSLRFIFCAAEEWGLYGSKGYVKVHKDELTQQVDQALVINVDMVGSELAYVEKAGLLIKKPLNENLNQFISEVALENDIEVRAFSTPLGNNSDHAPFRKLKMETAFFLSKKDTKKIHKPVDKIDAVDPQKLEDAQKLLRAVVFEYDTKVRNGLD
jgi:hypothetical protein